MNTTAEAPGRPVFIVAGRLGGCGVFGRLLVGADAGAGQG
jgi:hypothetical protein